QSIYGWRGASADTLAAFARDFGGTRGGTSVRHLSISWRNDRLILGAANATAGPLRNRTRVPVLAVRPRPAAGSGSVRISTLVTAEEEADAVATWLAQRWSAGSGRSAAILCRRRAQFTDIEPALIRAGLPYQIVGLGGLLSTPEVSDVLAALHVMHDPSRGAVLMRLLTGPSCRLGPHDLTVLGAWSRQLHRDRVAADQRARAAEAVDAGSLIEALDELPPVDWSDREGRELSSIARQRLGRLADTLRQLRARSSLALPDLITEVERALLLDIEVAARPGMTPAAARAQLDALAQVASDFAATADYPTLGAFLNWVTAAQKKERGLEPGQVDVQGEVIQVLTVHAAKGLEWDVVAVPGLVEGSFPQHKSRVAIGAEGWQAPTVTQQGWLSSLG
ncbi:MAG: 3'-5' exonuclease, partial [Angustibacter sp.]